MPEGQKPAKGEEPASIKSAPCGSSVAEPNLPLPVGVFVSTKRNDETSNEKEDEIRRDIDCPKSGIGETMCLLRAGAAAETKVTAQSPRQKNPTLTKASAKVDSAMEEIDIFSQPEDSGFFLTSCTVRRELSQTDLKVPVFIGTSDLTLRKAFKNTDIWHYVVTRDEYRNKLSALEVVRQLTDANVPKRQKSSKYNAFNQAVHKFVTKEALMVSDGGIDEDLWSLCAFAVKSFFKNDLKLRPDVVDEQYAEFRISSEELSASPMLGIAEGSQELVSYALFQVLIHIIHIVKYLFAPELETQSKSAAKNFYLQKGVSATSEKVKTQKCKQTGFVNSIQNYFSCQLSDYYYASSDIQALESQSFLTQSDSDSTALRERALRAMPDTGCPEFIAGLCWWTDYASLLQEANLLHTVMKGEAPGTYAFGDSPQKRACFRALQVPLFYRKATSAQESLLVFANITIVDNEVGLLNGKLDMAALDMKLELKSDPKLSKFWLSNTEIETQDTVAHFWFLLNQPRKFDEAERGISLQKRSDGRTVALSVNAEEHHQLAESFDPTIEVKKEKTEIQLAIKELGGDTLQELESGKISRNSECDEMVIASEYDDDLESNSSINIGIFEDIFNGNGEDLDTDSEYEFDEISHTFVKTMPMETLEAKDNESPSLDTKALAAFNVELAGVEMSKENATELISRLWDLHRSMNHPAPSQLLVTLQNSLPEGIKLPADVSRAILKLNCPRGLKNSRHNRVPQRPTVSVPACTAPGQVADMDNGKFDSPTGKFTGMLHVDEFSLKISGGVFSSAQPSAEEMVRKYVETVDEYYENVLVDLEGCFDSKLFSTFLEKQGTGLRFVPTGAHWANKAEKAVELVKVELASVFAEYPNLANDLAFKLAILSVNRRVMIQYKMSRLEVHWGRKAPSTPLNRLPLSAFTEQPLSPSLEDVNQFMECAQQQRSAKVRSEARRRLRQATRNRLPAKDPVELGNGDEFLIFHNDPVSKSKSGFRGVFICLGQVRSLIVGMRGRFIVTAHPSRVLLHQRGPHGLALNVKEDGVLPPRRTLEWEEPLLRSEVEEFARFLGSEEENYDDTGNTLQMLDEERGSQDTQADGVTELPIVEVLGVPEVEVVDISLPPPVPVTASGLGTKEDALQEVEDIPLPPSGQRTKEDDFSEVEDIPLPPSGLGTKEDDLPEVEDIVMPDTVDHNMDEIFADLEDLQRPQKDHNVADEIEEYVLPSIHEEVQDIVLPLPNQEDSETTDHNQKDLEANSVPEGDPFPFSRVASEGDNNLEDIVLPVESSEEAAALSLLEQITLPEESPEEAEVPSSIVLPEIVEDEGPPTGASLKETGLTRIT